MTKPKIYPDFVIHFNHPAWHDDHNDPSTATRVGERNMR